MIGMRLLEVLVKNSLRHSHLSWLKELELKFLIPNLPMDQLLRQIKTTNSLNRLFLSHMNPLKGEDLKILTELVAKTQKLEDLQLSFKEGGTKELKKVLQALNENKSITSLGIFDTNALQKDGRWMEFPLNNKTLKILRVNESYIGEKCSAKLAKYLENTETLTELDLGDRGITGFERITEALLKNNLETSISLTLIFFFCFFNFFLIVHSSFFLNASK